MRVKLYRELVPVSIHAPREGRRRRPIATRTLKCFDPRPHARGDQITTYGATVFTVSIHAPTRGATPALVSSCNSP